MFAKILLILIGLFVIIQFFQPPLNQTNGKTQADAIENAYSVPPDVAKILQKACNDCHLNNTKYPWYFRVQPVAWWLDHHIDEAKSELNYDAFLSYPPKKQDHKMKEVIEEVEKKEMPLENYTWLHKAAKLREDEKLVITNWAKQVRNEITFKTGFIPEKK